ncbi:MAG: ATP synthase F0 subunit B [Planctomycetota bacterium]
MTVWTTVGQIVNFLIFVVILHYLLYKPVGRMMRKRKEDMEAERREAEKKLQEAEGIRAETDRRAQELEERRETMLKETRGQAEEQKRQILQQAEDIGRDRLGRFRRTMEQEHSDLLGKVTGELRDTIVQVAGSALRDVSRELIDRALSRVEKLLDDLSDEDAERASKSLEKEGGRVPVRFMGTLDDDQLDRLRKALTARLRVKEIDLELNQDDALLAGLEVTLGHIQLEAHWRRALDEAVTEQQAGKEQE